jgi:hypothetical protein
VEARRHDEAEHGIETGRIVMTPEGGFTEIRDQVTTPLTLHLSWYDDIDNITGHTGRKMPP